MDSVEKGTLIATGNTGEEIIAPYDETIIALPKNWAKNGGEWMYLCTPE